MLQDFNTIDDEKGTIEIFYTTEFNTEWEGPFLKEERDLIQNIASLLTGYINSYKARDIIRLTQISKEEDEDLKIFQAESFFRNFSIVIMRRGMFFTI